jgi:hypothetical protein
MFGGEMARTKYKGFLIDSEAKQMPSEGAWRPSLLIEKHHGSGVDTAEILLGGIYETRETAARAAFV